jgi:NitT/TauT family transport system substrate-binding protein
MKRIIALLLLLTFTTAWPGFAAELKKIKAGHIATAEHLLYFVAKEKGFFKQEGLDVELFRFANSGEGLSAVKAGKLDIGFFGTAAPLSYIAKGAEFTIFGGGGGEGAALVAKPEKAGHYKSLKNLKGATVGVVRLATGDVVFRAALREAGVDWKKEVTFKEFDSPVAVLEAVKKGGLDAGVVWAPFYAIAEKQGLQVAVYSSDLIKGHTCCRQVALTEKVKERQQDFQHFLVALLRAYKFHQTNRDETVDIVAKYVQIDKSLIYKSIYDRHMNVDPDPNKKSVVQFWGFMNDIGYIDSKKQIRDNISTKLYANALAALRTQEPKEKLWKDLSKEFNSGEPDLHIKKH